MTETLARPKCFLHVVVRVAETLNPQPSAKCFQGFPRAHKETLK